MVSMNEDLNPVSDGEKVFEMACTCVLAVIAAVVVIAIVLRLAVR